MTMPIQTSSATDGAVSRSDNKVPVQAEADCAVSQSDSSAHYSAPFHAKSSAESKSAPPSNPLASPPRRIPGLNFLPTSSPMRQRQLDDLIRSASGSSIESPPRKLSAGISSSGSGAPSPRRKTRRGKGKKGGGGGGGEGEPLAGNLEKHQNEPLKEQRRRQPKQQQQQQDEHKTTITKYFPASPNHVVKAVSLNNNNDDCVETEGDEKRDVSKTRSCRSGDGIVGITHLGNGDSATSQQQQPPQQLTQTPGKKKKRRRKKTAASSEASDAVTACPHHHGLLSPPGIKTGGKRGRGGGGKRGTTVQSAVDDQRRQSHLTDFYQVRRSDRRPKSEKEKEEKERIICRIADGSTTGLRVDDMPLKGRGVVADHNFARGDFIIEYDGDLISCDEAKERENEYKLNPSVGCYMYYFTFQNRKYCVDATSESGKLGRLINHSTKTPNLMTRLFPIGDRPHLIFVAARDIDAGEELMYDYGDRSKEAAEAHPWLKF